MSAQVAIVFHSGYGHTAKQAKAVHAGVAEVAHVKVDSIGVEQIEQHWETLQAATAIVFGSPTYMGSVSAAFKTFMEATSAKAYMTQAWLNKLAGGFTNSGSQSGDKLMTLMQMQVFSSQMGMLWVPLGMPAGNNHSKGSPEDLNRLGGSMGAMAQSNVDAPHDMAPPPADLKTAHMYGKRIAELALRWHQSKA